MANAFKGRVKKQFYFKPGDFLTEVSNWQNKTNSHINGKLGYINGAINHKWHGSKKQRGFSDRRKIINSVNFPYKPNKHVYYDTDGLIHFHPKVKKYFNFKTRSYFLSRNEDAN
jgi:hypothetical protein